MSKMPSKETFIEQISEAVRKSRANSLKDLIKV